MLATLTAIVTVFVIPPPVAVTVRVELPTLAIELLVRVKVLVPLPGAPILGGLRLVRTPQRAPATNNASGALNPATACVVKVTVALPPGCSDTALVEVEKVKPGTFTVILVL